MGINQKTRQGGRWPRTGTHAARLQSAATHAAGPESTFAELQIVQVRKRANKAFLKAELNCSRGFLDNVEARPLSAEQRRAVCVDDDRNLVVAAAGSGKTSVMVAKAGWLVERGDTKPDRSAAARVRAQRARRARGTRRTSSQTGGPLKSFELHARMTAFVSYRPLYLSERLRAVNLVESGRPPGATNCPLCLEHLGGTRAPAVSQR